MEGLRQAIEKIEQLAQSADARVLDINERKYATKQLYEIEKRYDSPKTITLNTLESLADIIKTELAKAHHPLFVNVKSPEEVTVFSTYHDTENCRRDYLYSAEAELPVIVFDKFIDYESTMISLRSKFVETEDVAYLLDLLSKITDQNSVESEDNGLSQTVQGRRGIAMVQNATVRPKVKLQPFRTFLEVEQPASEFLVRMQEGGHIGLFEADGGAWKLEAKQNIYHFLIEALSSEIQADKVVVIA